MELYNYYKIYKLDVIGNAQDKLINILKEGQNFKIYYHFRDFIYKEKCKLC